MGVNVAYEAERGVDETIVLVVEDEVLIRLMIADALRAQGLRVIEASNSEEALTVLRSTLPVQLIITDISMANGMNGVELARSVRADHPDMKLIIASGQPVVDSFSGLADAFFRKPVDMAALVRRVKELLGGARHVAGRQ